MAASTEFNKYDDVLTSILVSEKSLLGFLSAIFNFLARRTDFYYVPEGPNENMGFPPGVAEQLVVKVLRKCDPKNWTESTSPTDIHDEIMCSTVAQEVEIETEEVIVETNEHDYCKAADEPVASQNDPPQYQGDKAQFAVPELTKEVSKMSIPEDYTPPVIPTQRNSESYNGAIRENYTWSQNIMELDVIIKLPQDCKSSKDLKVTINSGDLSVLKKTGEVIVKDSLLHKIKTSESLWSISEGRLLIHLEKAIERWWNKLLASEEEIDLDKIDCSRPIDDLPQDHVQKIRELQWNQERKMQGLPTTDEMRNMEILKKAWNAEGSPFKGTEFDPSVLHK